MTDSACVCCERGYNGRDSFVPNFEPSLISSIRFIDSKSMSLKKEEKEGKPGLVRSAHYTVWHAAEFDVHETYPRRRNRARPT